MCDPVHTKCCQQCGPAQLQLHMYPFIHVVKAHRNGWIRGVSARCNILVSTLAFHTGMLPTTFVAPTSLESVAVTGARNRALNRFYD